MWSLICGGKDLGCDGLGRLLRNIYFALTGKPQVLYVYDCREYEKEFGLFYDMETFSPFPTAKNQDELCAAIRNCAVSRDGYAKFVAEHLGYENGTATRQVVDYMCEVGEQ